MKCAESQGQASKQNTLNCERYCSTGSARQRSHRRATRPRRSATQSTQYVVRLTRSACPTRSARHSNVRTQSDFPCSLQMRVDRTLRRESDMKVRTQIGDSVRSRPRQIQVVTTQHRANSHVLLTSMTLQEDVIHPFPHHVRMPMPSLVDCPEGSKEQHCSQIHS